jgi:hypothetical protein
LLPYTAHIGISIKLLTCILRYQVRLLIIKPTVQSEVIRHF